MVHLEKPGVDEGVFSTDEVRSRDKPDESTSRIIAFPPGHYRKPPNVAGGFKMLDLSYEAPIRANLCGSDISKDSFRITLETWDGGVLYGASAQWLEHKSGARDCQFGQFDTLDLDPLPPFADEHNPTNHTNGDSPSYSNTANGTSAPATADRKEYTKTIRFRRPFSSPPQVICWLNRLDMFSSPTHDTNYRINAYATNISTTGFVAHIDTWGDSILHGAAMCFVAFPGRKKHVASGRFSTADVRPWHDPRSKNSAVVKFERAFEKRPTVLVALHAFDMAGNADLRIRVDVSDVTREGFRWHLNTWDDSTMYSGSAMWIALGFV